MEIVLRSPRCPRSEAARASRELMDQLATTRAVDQLVDVLVVIAATPELTVADVNAVADAIAARVHPDAELEIDASTSLTGADEIEIAIALP